MDSKKRKRVRWGRGDKKKSHARVVLRHKIGAVDVRERGASKRIGMNEAHAIGIVCCQCSSAPMHFISAYVRKETILMTWTTPTLGSLVCLLWAASVGE